MSTWHETMMKSSDSFRECHEERKSGWDGFIKEPVELVNDYPSMTKQNDSNNNPHFWSIYYADYPIELGRNYKVVINDEVFNVKCETYMDMPALVDWENNLGIIIRFNKNVGSLLISYYPADIDEMGSNITTNFELWEMSYDKIPLELLPDEILALLG